MLDAPFQTFEDTVPKSLLLLAVMMFTGCQAGARFPAIADLPSARSLDFTFQQGQIVESDSDTHIAISGDAFFVLSAQEHPKTLDDLIFTRDGKFQFDLTMGRNQFGEPINAPGAYRLRSSNGYFVLGYSSSVDTKSRPFGAPPNENRGNLRESLDLSYISAVPGTQPQRVPLQGILVDFERNSGASNQFSFDAQGLLRIKGKAPFDSEGGEVNIYIGLVKFANPSALFYQGAAYWRYAPAAGTISAGVAANDLTGADTVVGSTNVLHPRAIEVLRVPPLPSKGS